MNANQTISTSDKNKKQEGRGVNHFFKKTNGKSSRNSTVLLFYGDIVFFLVSVKRLLVMGPFRVNRANISHWLVVLLIAIYATGILAQDSFDGKHSSYLLLLNVLTLIRELY